MSLRSLASWQRAAALLFFSMFLHCSRTPRAPELRFTTAVEPPFSLATYDVQRPALAGFRQVERNGRVHQYLGGLYNYTVAVYHDGVSVGEIAVLVKQCQTLPAELRRLWGSPQTLNYVANERTPGEPMEFWYPKGSKWFAGVLAYANGGCRLRFLNTQRLGTQPTHFAAFKWAQFGTMIRSLDVDVRDVDALRWPGLVDGSVDGSFFSLLDIWPDRQEPLWAYGGVLPTHVSHVLQQNWGPVSTERNRTDGHRLVSWHAASIQTCFDLDLESNEFTIARCSAAAEFPRYLASAFIGATRSSVIKDWGGRPAYRGSMHQVSLPRHAWMLGSAAAEAALTFDSKDVVTSVDVKWEKLAPALLANVLQTFTAAWGAPIEVLGQSVRTYTYAGAAQRRIEVNVIGTGSTAEHDLRIFIAAVPAVAQSGQ